MEFPRLTYLNVYILEFTVRLYSNKVEKIQTAIINLGLSLL